jgi:hypothetical protein
VGLGFSDVLRRSCGQVGDSGGVLDLPEAGEQVDGVQLVTVMSNAWSASSISSREGGEDRLERRWRPWDFGR